ncbi:hypothetical protein MVEN_01191100 [Mycena venus]|uniref:VWFA domain-containing protein n=1 Tax=Mycena venus TaxID=2733690 RepID=A0A8H6Y4H4_9AGAR|nr:hypothetical protein MVEN_01191100 [Mycena venus]
MQKPPLTSTVDSKSASDLTAETEEWTSYFPGEAVGPRRRSFLSAVFSHSRSRSADARDALPPSYESLVASNTHKRSKSSSKFTSSSWLKRPMRSETLEDALEILRKYDTVILVDDSGSMTLPGSKRGKTRWNEAGEALETLAETAQRYDGDGIDIYFLNNKTASLNIKSPSEVRALFAKVKPSGATPTGERLDQILKPRLRILEDASIEPDGTPTDKKSGDEIKRVNIIVITDGEATDNPKYSIIDAASRLKAMPNLCMIQACRFPLNREMLFDSIYQLGIQFVQIGNDSRATKALKELDDDLHKTRNIRDIVDTTPYSKLNPVTADGLIKVLLGGINRRIDELARY